ncbi:hypothetical protein MKK55_02180 [Methylobacterium sp. J-059]|uniref:hypothetical protein n=1 Tax=Methylobacterium sp. J-059 TaxID=2836643 RepID=UPI001FBA0627|nr:hypothetical protein [Methylobacterium sp. J-059]MCJ2037765.1 hypothetical protein [Methylobacterium sp. J-059]
MKDLLRRHGLDRAPANNRGTAVVRPERLQPATFVHCSIRRQSVLRRESHASNVVGSINRAVTASP